MSSQRWGYLIKHDVEIGIKRMPIYRVTDEIVLTPEGQFMKKSDDHPYSGWTDTSSTAYKPLSAHEVKEAEEALVARKERFMNILSDATPQRRIPGPPPATWRRQKQEV